MSKEEASPAKRLTTVAFQNHAAELQRFLLRRIRCPQDADDLAQEVFARLLRVRDAEVVRNPLAYLLGIAVHVVREFQRRHYNERVLFDSEIAADGSDNIDQLQAMGELEQLELRSRLDHALSQLPPTHQMVLLLVKRDGMSYSEAAQAAGLSVHTVEKYLVEARARLRVILSEESQAR